MLKTIIRLFALIPVLIAATPTHAEIPQSQQQVQLSFAPLVKQVSPAVVNIYTRKMVERAYNPFAGHPFFNSPFFNNNRFGQRMQKQAESSLGSGVIVDPDGLIITNAHVIRDATEITVVLSDGRELDAELALSDEASDLALLRVAADAPLPSVSLKSSETLEVGDLVLAIGNPFGVDQTVTSGIVSAQGRSSLNINNYNFFIQTDAAINPGNSGGPLVALDGGVVGINTAIYSRDGGSLGIGFAVPSEMVATIIAAEAAGRMGDEGVIRPWLGVSAQAVTSDIAQSLNLSIPRGALINGLHPLSPLKEAGLKVGDVMLTLKGREIRDPIEMKFRMATVPLGQSADIVYLSEGFEKQAKIRAIAPPDTPARNATTLSGAHILNGAIIANINPAIITELGIASEDEGVVVMEAPRGTQSSRVVRAGDILLSINGADIKTVKDAKNALSGNTARSWAITIKSKGQVRQIVVR